MRTFLKIIISLGVEALFIAAGKGIGEGGVQYLLTPRNGSSDGTPIGTMLVLVGGVVSMVLGAILGGVTLLYG